MSNLHPITISSWTLGDQCSFEERVKAAKEAEIVVLAVGEDMAQQSEKTFPRTESDAHIVFDHVSFSYLGQKDNLTNISFTLKRGESLGIIGATGSGKSTIAHLLLRLYDVTAGQIRLNGTDIRKIPMETLHQAFGIVFQSDVLFADTIAENIRFGRELTDEQLKLAARYAQAEEFISTKEDRFAFQLSSRGSNLSGGQKQRLLIARALAGNSPILVLDDSSSALDYKTDASLRQAIR